MKLTPGRRPGSAPSTDRTALPTGLGVTAVRVMAVAHALVLVACSDPAFDDPDAQGGAGEDDGGRVDGAAEASLPGPDGGSGAPDASTKPAPKVLAAPVAQLAAEVASRSPGTGVGIAVMDLKTGEYAGASDEERHVSASAPKAIWVAAALAKSGVDAVSPYAQAIFRDSDNAASGTAIDLAGGIDAVNVFYAKSAGMVDSAMSQWTSSRVATNSPRKMGNDNYFTAKDAVTFLARLDNGTLLGAAQTKQLETWMTWSPRTGFGGWLGTLLPPAARASMMHKGGWLPPDCCGDDGTYNTLNEIGIVEVAPGHRYAVAILARRGNDWYGKQAPWVERASCVIYRAASETPQSSLGCKD